MTGAALRVAWYRFGATFRSRRGAYLSLVLLVGLLGGLAMGAIAAARRTQSSFVQFAQNADASDLVVPIATYNPSAGLDAGYYPGIERAIARLPHVRQVESQVELDIAPLGRNGQPIPASEGIGINGSLDGVYIHEDRPFVAHGRMVKADKDEFVMDAATARAWGVHLGEKVRFFAITNAQSLSPTASFATIKPYREFTATLVGVGVTDVGHVVQDDVDAINDSFVLMSPALTDPLVACCANDSFAGISLDGGVIGGLRYEAAVEREVAAVLPKGVPHDFVEASVVEGKAERSIRPESIALAVFGGIAALAAVVIAGQVIARRLQVDADDLAVVRALGADPVTTLADGLLGLMGAVVVGALLACAVAVALSPLAPLGPVRPYLPVSVDVDWTVIGAGMGVLVVALGLLALAGAYREAPQRSARRRQAHERGSTTARVAAAAGLSPPAVTGIRFALEPGSGRSAAPVRSAIVGALLAVVVVTATVTFGASMNTLVSHPTLYGWNWTYEINGGGGLGDIPTSQVTTLLARDRFVAAWSGVYFSTLSIDGQDVPVLGASPGAAVAPPVLSGHGLEAADQIVLGAGTLAALHQRIGNLVTVSAPGTAPVRLRIVGTATLPAIGIGGISHLEMGTGAVLAHTHIPEALTNIFDIPTPGPNAILVRTTPGAGRAAAVRSLQGIIDTLGLQGDGAAVQAVQRPAEINVYRSLGATPALLGVTLAAGAVGGLGLTLVASVRRRRRALALLKTLGFTTRQLAASVAWQSTVAVGIGTVVGVPLGIVLGRVLWDLFVGQIDAVPDPTVPGLWIAVIAAGAVVLANLVAAVPGMIAARTETAVLLRAE